MLFWNSMEVTTFNNFVWDDNLLDAQTSAFKNMKRDMEQEVL